MCEYCKMELNDSDDDGWEYYACEKSMEDDDASGVSFQLYATNTGNSGMYIDIDFEWSKAIRVRVGDSECIMDVPISVRDTVDVSGVRFCPMCGRDLLKAVEDAQAALGDERADETHDTRRTEA